MEIQANHLAKRASGYIPIMAVKSFIISDILICCGQTCSQPLHPTQFAGRASCGILPTAMGAIKPPPVILCSLYRAISSGISAGDIHYDAWEYVLSFSNLLPLSREELANLSDNEDLPVHSRPDASSGISVIPADTEVYFLATDMTEWILVKGKNSDKGYMQAADGKIVDLDKTADEIISDLYFFD